MENLINNANLQDIEVRHVRNAGTDRFYPANEAATLLISGLMKQKTLTPENVQILKILGFKIIVVAEQARQL